MYSEGLSLTGRKEQSDDDVGTDIFARQVAATFPCVPHASTTS